jgi:hypothetical protein
MGLLKKKPDPLSERAQMLNAQIATLEAQIARLSTQPAPAPAPARAAGSSQARFRSTAIPHGPTVNLAPTGQQAVPDPVFEELDQKRLKDQPETGSSSHYHELGIRKYDLPAAWRRLIKNFRGPPASNPKLVNYLAAGSVQGLRPLRYEKRIARNRFLVFLVGLILLLLGLMWHFVPKFH